MTPSARRSTHGILIAMTKSSGAHDLNPPSTWTTQAIWWWKSIGSGLLPRFETLVDFDLIAGGEAVGFVGDADNRHHLGQHGVAHARFPGGSSVRGDTVAALVAGADRDVEHFLGQRVERAGRHDFLNVAPDAAEGRWI